MNHTIKYLFDEHIALFSLYSEQDLANIAQAAASIADTFLNGGKLYLCGTGASNLIAKYAASLFVQHCKMDRPPLPAIALNADVACTSQDSNDFYEKQITAFATGADIIWGIAIDDKAEPVARALRTAAQNNIKTLGLSGSGRKTLAGVCDILITVDHPEMLRVQEMHIFIIHAICEIVDRIIFDPSPLSGQSFDHKEDTLI